MSLSDVTWHSVPEEVQQPSLQQQNVLLQQQNVQLRLELERALARAQAHNSCRPDSQDKTAAVIAQLRREKAMLLMEVKALKRDAAQWQKQKQQLTDTVAKNGLDNMDTAW
jgi:predicted  nucleic acid-binding Zn-ribbon protein